MPKGLKIFISFSFRLSRFKDYYFGTPNPMPRRQPQIENFPIT